MKTEELQKQLARAQATVRTLQEELAETNRGLVALTLEMEQRVDQRTAELRAAHEELTKTNSELMQLTLELEDRVAQRTAELRATNEVLQDQITERRRTEAAAASSQERFKLIFESIPVGVALAHQHPDGRIKRVINDAHLRICGLTREQDQIPGIYLKITHPEDAARQAELGRPFNDGRDGQFAMEKRYLRPDGTVVWVAFTFRRQHCADGSIEELTTVVDITGHKQAEEALRESEHRYRRITEGLTDYQYSVRVKNGRAVKTTQSPACVAVTGYAAKEFDADPYLWFRMIAPEDRELIRERVQQVLAGKEIPPIEHRIIRKDGAVRWVCDTIILFKDSAGKLVSYDGVIKDITERRRAEEAQRASAAYARSLIETSLDPLVTISAEGKITDVNEASVQATGVARQQLIGTDFSDYFTEPEKAREGYRRVFSEGLVRDYPLAIRHVSGRVTDVLYHASVYRGGQGQVLGVFAAARDITERKQAEAVVRAERQRFQEVLDQLPAYLVLLSPDYHVPFANRFFRERFGESYGRRCYEHLFHRTEPCEICETYSVLKTHAPHHWEWTGPDGRNYDIHDFPFKDADGSPLIMEVGLDITEQKRAAAEVCKLNAELEQRVVSRTAQLEAANEELESFSYSVSHDLRAPLRHIIGFVKLLEERAGPLLSETSRRHLRIISDSAQRMGNLIDDLLAFSRVGRTEMKVTEVQLDQLVGETLDDFQEDVAGRDIVWKINPLPLVRADRALLRQVLVNLISNAVKFTSRRAQARIEIGVMEKGSDGVVPSTEHPNAPVLQHSITPVFFIRDNGAGFNPEYAGQLFGVFQRLHSQEDFPGTGIGLANVKRIIHRHGGRVWAEGQVDGGATFYFSLPNPNGGGHEH